jgi:hypothetical protein
MAPPVGEKHFRARLTDDTVRELRRRYAEERISYMDLANEYDIGVHTAWSAITRKTWRHVK